MTAEASGNNIHLILDLLSRHEDGYDVYDTVVVPSDAHDEAIELIRSIRGIDLDPVFITLASTIKITPGKATIDYHTRLTLH